MIMMTTYNAESTHQYIAIPQDKKLEPIVMKEVETVAFSSQGKQSSLSLLLQQSKHYSVSEQISAVDSTTPDYSSGAVTSASEASSLATSPILNQPTPKEQEQQQSCCLTFNCPKPEKSLSRVKINRYQFTPPPPSNMLSFDSDEDEDEDRDYDEEEYRDDDENDYDDNDFDDNDNEFVMD